AGWRQCGRAARRSGKTKIRDKLSFLVTFLNNFRVCDRCKIARYVDLLHRAMAGLDIGYARRGQLAALG
ncbi:hypothetical protein, partial [Achromobacter xylosoxidans]